MRLKYPNLELLEYKILQALPEMYPEMIPETISVNTQGLNVSVDMFQQIWHDAPDGMHRLKAEGMPEEMTYMYTSVFAISIPQDRNGFHTEKTFYAVCFGDQLAYILDDLAPGNQFFADLKNRSMAGIWYAGNRYSDKEEG